MLMMNLHDLFISSRSTKPSLTAHLRGQGEDLAPPSVRVVADRLCELGGNDTSDTCAEHLALVVQKDTGVVVETGCQLNGAGMLAEAITTTYRTIRPSGR